LAAKPNREGVTMKNKRVKKFRVCVLCGNYHHDADIRWLKVGTGNTYKIEACKVCRDQYKANRAFRLRISTMIDSNGCLLPKPALVLVWPINA